MQVQFFLTTPVAKVYILRGHPSSKCSKTTPYRQGPAIPILSDHQHSWLLRNPAQAYHPQTNELTECLNHTLTDMLPMYISSGTMMSLDSCLSICCSATVLLYLWTPCCLPLHLPPVIMPMMPLPEPVTPVSSACKYLSNQLSGLTGGK